MKTTDIALNIYKHYREKYPLVNNYYGIIANYGLTSLAEIGTQFERSQCKEVLDSFPDKVEHPYYNFPSYRIGGIAKARAVYDKICDDNKSVFAYALELITAPRNHLGIVGHPKDGEHEKVWIDVATAVTPFLLYAGLTYEREDFINEAANQTLSMYDLLLDKKHGLLHQSIGFVGEGKMSADHWSRGNGWGALPLAELCAHLPDGHPDKSRCIEYFNLHAKSLRKYQSASGMWRQEITVESENGAVSFEEASGTGLILYAIGLGIEYGALDRATYLPVLEKGIKGLYTSSVNTDFSTDNSCPGCLSPADGSIYAYLTHTKPFRDEPHGAGPIILALCSAQRCGITEL